MVNCKLFVLEQHFAKKSVRCFFIVKWSYLNFDRNLYIYILFLLKNVLNKLYMHTKVYFFQSSANMQAIVITVSLFVYMQINYFNEQEDIVINKCMLLDDLRLFQKTYGNCVNINNRFLLFLKLRAITCMICILHS